LVAIVVVDPPIIKKWASENGITVDNDVTPILSKPEINKAIIDSLLELAKVNKFSGLEKIKKIHLTADPFTIENELLTHTMKIKRHKAKEVFLKEIDEMYASM
jgi:long-chain acyl-CoA synthetase